MGAWLRRKPSRSKAKPTRSRTAGRMCRSTWWAAGCDLDRRSPGVAGRFQIQPAQPGAGAAQPGRRSPVGGGLERAAAAPPARQRQPDPPGLPRIRPGSDVRGRDLRRFRPALAALPPIAFRKRDGQAGELLAGEMVESRPGTGHARPGPAAQRCRRGDHRAGQGFLAHPANQESAQETAFRRAERPGLLPPTAAPGLPADLPVRRRRPRSAARSKAQMPLPANATCATTPPPACAAWQNASAAGGIPICGRGC